MGGGWLQREPEVGAGEVGGISTGPEMSWRCSCKLFILSMVDVQQNFVIYWFQSKIMYPLPYYTNSHCHLNELRFV